jgi:hypothetical protein
MNTMTWPPCKVKPSGGAVAQMLVFVVGLPLVHASVIGSGVKLNANVVKCVDDVHPALRLEAMQAAGTLRSVVPRPTTDATMSPPPPGQFVASRQIWKPPEPVPMVSWPLPVGSNITLFVSLGVRTVVRSTPAYGCSDCGGIRVASPAAIADAGCPLPEPALEHPVNPFGPPAIVVTRIRSAPAGSEPVGTSTTS